MRRLHPALQKGDNVDLEGQVEQAKIVRRHLVNPTTHNDITHPQYIANKRVIQRCSVARNCHVDSEFSPSKLKIDYRMWKQLINGLLTVA